MSDELLLNGKTYVSSKRAADATGYARDYIGQLSRGGQIDAERVGGLWYVSMESLQGYEKNAETARSFSPAVSAAKDGESLLIFEGKDYISASRASKLTGYNQDYVGQLARGGKIPSRQIGNRWYVDRDALVQHKTEKDALLAAVQAEAVGLRAGAIASPVAPIHKPLGTEAPSQLTYVYENIDLLPRIPEKRVESKTMVVNLTEMRPQSTVRVAPEPLRIPVEAIKRPKIVPMYPKKNRKRVIGASVGALTIILVLSVAVISLEGSETFAGIASNQSVQNITAGAARATDSVGDIIENWVAPELVYERGQ